jgi:predicted nucleic acid-binding Zn ribbon protein
MPQNEPRACIVCGHELGPYLRICDKCGSIQRPIGGDGVPIPPDQITSCLICGKPVLMEDRICAECIEAAASEEVVAQAMASQETAGKRKAKIVSAAVGSVSLAATAASIWALIAVGGAVFTAILAVSGLTLILSTGLLISLARTKKQKIEVWSGRTEEQKKSAEPARLR